ncbi:gp16 family protein [uncultured Shewanella sp.]|uniref:gp16 family protein n=1 Tax=uncultured Shewanella sp. TaxID=173975 RepID=UPI002622C0E9|nr:regulatory protein GemA [uncultured Shewanella sp.]
MSYPFSPQTDPQTDPQVPVRVKVKNPAKRRLITLINIAKQQLNIDEYVYRAMLTSCVGKNSLRVMTLSELEQVLTHFKQKGFTPHKSPNKQSAKGRLSPKGGKAKVAEIDKIRAIWITMFKQNIVRDGSETALDSYVRRMSARLNITNDIAKGVDSVAWLNPQQAYTVLESLKSWHKRAMQVRLEQLGIIELKGYDKVLTRYLENENLIKQSGES